MHFSAILYLLTSICVISAVNLFLLYKLRKLNVFNGLLMTYNAYLGCHALYILIVEQFFVREVWLDRYAPFALMYGPFLYFAFISISEQKISRKVILWHSTPFACFSLVFIGISVVNVSSDFINIYYRALLIVTAFSFSFYTILAIIFNDKPLEIRFKQRKLIGLSAIIILIFVSMITVSIVFSEQRVVSNPTATDLIRTIMYCCMLVSALMVFRYETSLIFLRLHQAEPLSEAPAELLLHRVKKEPSVKYEKSTLSEKQLIDYQDKLEDLMENKRVFLMTDLSLQKLALLMHTPSHHLTQVFSLQMKTSFYDYVNQFRVNYAQQLLKNENQLNLEEVAERSGFNSKVSFNRNFKAILSVTPSEYRNQFSS